MTFEEYKKLLAEGKVPATFNLTSAGKAVAIKAAHEVEGKKRLPTFKGRAYNGGRMHVEWFGDIVVDLAGISVTEKQRPMLKDHNQATPVGHTQSLEGKGNGVTIGKDFVDVEGLFSIESEETDKIVTGGGNGFEWQMSIGANPTKLVFVDEESTIEANGRTFEGPVIVARESELKEISFLPLGADDTTTSSVAAKAAEFKKESGMTFSQWLIACKHDESKLSDEVKKVLKATFDQQKADGMLEAKVEPEKPVEVPAVKPVEAGAVPVIDVAAATAQVVANTQAILLEQNKIATLCAGNVELHEQAIKEKWDSGRIEAEVKLKNMETQRENNISGFSINGGSGSGEIQSNDIEISILRAGGYSDEKIIAEYGQDAIEASDKRYQKTMGIQEAICITARMNGYSGRSNNFKGDKRGYFEAAIAINASTSFSTIGGLNGLFANVANKSFQEGFMNVEQVWREVTAIGRVNDFKEKSRFTLTGDMVYQKIGPGGEFKHGKVGTEKYTNQADTYGLMFGINRHDIINDDLDALSTVPNRLGRGSGINRNRIFWTEFLNNAAFFTAARNNLIEVGPLSIAELTRMNTAFRLQKDPDGNPMNDRASILLTGVENEELAGKLFSDKLIVTGEDSTQTDGNQHKGKFKPLSSAYISDSAFGGSTTESYLLADPKVTPVIEVVFLDGQEMPIVESQAASFDTLGINFRAFEDFGVNEQEFRGGVKSKGAA